MNMFPIYPKRVFVVSPIDENDGFIMIYDDCKTIIKSTFDTHGEICYNDKETKLIIFNELKKYALEPMTLKQWKIYQPKISIAEY